LVDGASIIIYIQMLRKCEGGITVVLIVLLLISRSGNISIPYCPRFNLNNNKKNRLFLVHWTKISREAMFMWQKLYINDGYEMFWSFTREMNNNKIELFKTIILSQTTESKRTSHCIIIIIIIITIVPFITFSSR